MDDNDPRIERLARAFCAAEGIDPDIEHEATEAGDLWGVTPTGSGIFTRFVGPKWRVYGRLARAHVIAHDILGS
jgi:hypothetical protein